MVCVYCSADTKIINSRKSRLSNKTWRRHCCLSCNSVFTSIETPDYQNSWRVLGKNSDLTPFVREKLFLSIHNSCKHRKSALNDSKSLTDTVVSHLKSNNGVIERGAIYETVVKVLKRFDKAALSHFTAYHQKNRF